MFEKDRLAILSIIEAIQKIHDYTHESSNADEFYESQRDFDAAPPSPTKGEGAKVFFIFRRKNLKCAPTETLSCKRPDASLKY